MGKIFHATTFERAIGRALQEWRHGKQMSLAEASRQVGFSDAKISMMENAIQPSSSVDIVALGLTYKVPAPERQELAREADWAARQRVLALVDDGVMFEAARDIIQLEFEASVLRTFKIDLLHGIFQIAGYTNAAIAADEPLRARVIAEQQTQIRAARQARLRDKHPLQVEAVFSEAVIRQLVGGSSVLKAQLLHLIELAELPNVVIEAFRVTVGDVV